MAAINDQIDGVRPLHGLRGLWRIAAARLRFLAVFAAVFAVVAGWDAIRSSWNRLWTKPPAEAATSSDTEFFCPMDPGVLSDWPSKCPACNMTLVRRKRGDAAPLPDGVMARMQMTPYRLWLGGIQTATAEYAPLARTVDLPGTVTEAGKDGVRIQAEAFARELRWLAPGRVVEIARIDGDGQAPAMGRVVQSPTSVEAGAVGKVVVSTEEAGSLRSGDSVRIKAAYPIEQVDPFRNQPSTPPALMVGEPRRLFTCMEHADVVRDAPGRCPRDGSDLMERPLREDQRVRWWCPMHPETTADRGGAKCEACQGMALVPRVVSYRPPGRVLAIPASAAISGEGGRSFVFVDRGEGMFEAKSVALGPRCGAMIPVASGLGPGDRVVAQGGILLDAETRLDPSLAAGYFGAGETASVAKPSSTIAKTDAPTEPAWLRELAETDRALALAQKICPVTGKPLGSMGTPPKVVVSGRAVFLCCEGCTPAAETNPEKYLSKLPSASTERRP
ncbi:heavy metal-binding domain-containing protein [Paludisphaera rhizosphaerae]|uniref:heavy metal-binding domain-containing protein n=1 Tax=Paludisphaera rhizosphaerae TaxID=2711216 RepID=UPI0013E9F6BB|nr:heavy metal-binding domain-containing protein [Paludisphaera rhizosphaerae]